MHLNVLVCGCGNLGRWHIKGLEKSQHDISVYALDIAEPAFELLTKFCEENLCENSNVTIKKHLVGDDNLSDLPAMDLVIIATTAVNRELTFARLCAGIESRFWLLEKPIAQSAQKISEIAKQAAGKAVFVNHPRRIMPWHRAIKSVLENRGRILVQASYPNLGIACNASHYVDLMNWWTNEQPVNVNVDQLNSFWRTTKREGFMEVDGCLDILFDGGSKLTLHSGLGVKNPGIAIHLHGSATGSIDESSGVAHFSDGKKVKGSIVSQSLLTGVVLDDLCLSGRCDLPTLELSAANNLLIMSALLNHWNSCCNTKLQLLPIT